VAHERARGDATSLLRDDPVFRHQGFRLLVLHGELRGQEFDVLAEAITLGKSRTCDVVLSDDSVSRQHAEVVREGHGYRLRDLNSTNGTFVGEARVSEAFLQPGDVLGIGKVKLRFTPREAPAELLPSQRDRFGEVIGHSLAMRKLFSVLERVAPSLLPVLIEGETGSGKDLVARAIHAYSARAEGPFVVVDCGAVAGQLEAELFGLPTSEGLKGALEQAQGGTLLLDGIAELPVELQPKLLRALEAYRTPSTNEETTGREVRVLAASHVNLEARASSGEFREDLYFRLAVVSVRIPALRERREDIPWLIEHFSRRLPAGLWTPPGPEAMARLVGYDWPGNVRELRNVVERSAFLSPDGVIDLVSTRSHAKPMAGIEFDPTLTFREQKERATELFEEAYVRWLMLRSSGNVSRAAREADMDRKYLHKLLRRYAIDAKQFARR